MGDGIGKRSLFSFYTFPLASDSAALFYADEKAVADRRRIRAQDLEDAENRRRERREEREHEIAMQINAQKRAMDLAKFSHPVDFRTIPSEVGKDPVVSPISEV